MELMTEEKKAFKKTELGEFPEDWILKPICESTNYVDYRGATPKKVDHGITLVTAKNIKKGYIDYSESKEYVKPENYDEIMSRGKPEIGDILITTEAPLGHVAAVDNTNIALAQRVIKYRAIESFLDNDYLKYFFLSDRFQENLYTNSSGSTATGIKGSVLHKLPICFPPNLEEQQAIASALSDVDELIRSLDGLIQKKQAIKKGTMQQLLTGIKRLPGFDGDWEVKKLGDVCQIISGGTPSTRNSEYWDGNIDWCTPTDITSNKGKYLSKTSRKITKQGLKNSSASLLPKGTLLLCSRATVGEIKIATSQISTNQGFKSLICSDFVDNEFLYYLIILKKQKFIDKAFGSTFLEISKKNTSEIEFELPSTKEQKVIAQILSDMDRELQTLRQKREKYKQIKQGMMQELLTGNTRLV